jgi:hypothetical protein
MGVFILKARIFFENSLWMPGDGRKTGGAHGEIAMIK